MLLTDQRQIFLEIFGRTVKIRIVFRLPKLLRCVVEVDVNENKHLIDDSVQSLRSRSDKVRILKIR